MAERFLRPDGHLHGVVVACQRADGRWLMIRRSASVRAPLKVCFPGGALDEGEDQETALRREMQEELGTVVEPVRCVWHHRWPDRPLILWGWLAKLKSTTLTPNSEEVNEVLWLNEAEALRHPDVLPNTDAFFQALRQAMD